MRRPRTRLALLFTGLVAGLTAAMLASGQPVGHASGPKTAEGAEEPDAAVPVEVVEVATGDVSTYITATTNLEAEHQVSVVAEREGRVVQLAAEEGDDVRKGTTLATLGRRDARMTLEGAKIKSRNAKRKATRASTLSNAELISAEEFEQLETDRDLAAHEMSEAKLTLARSQVRAPLTGRVTRRSVDRGAWVRVGDELFEVTGLDQLIAHIYVPEADALVLEPGRTVQLVLSAAPKVQFKGHIRRIGSVVDVQTGTVKVTIAVDEVPGQVRAGSFVSLRVVREANPHATWVPRHALLRDPQRTRAFVIEDGVASERVVVTGAEEGERIVITSGLQPGDQIVVAGHSDLKDGTTVTLEE